MMRYLLFTFLWFMFLGCDRDKIGPQKLGSEPAPVLKGHQVYLINEGNFQHGNASISAYNPDEKKVTHQVYSIYNNNLPLGDVAQDLKQHEGRFYIVMNNSGVVRVADTTSWKHLGDIPQFSAPRYISFFGNRAFVTDLYTRKLRVLNLDRLSTDSIIPLPGVGYHTTLWNEKIAVGLPSHLMILDPNSLRIDTLISLSRGVERMRIDHSGNLWVLCTGTSGSAALYSISPDLNIHKSWTFPAGDKPSFLSINGEGDQLYFIKADGIYRQKTSAADLTPVKLVVLQEQEVYGFDVDPDTNDLYLVDALDFNQASDIFRYSENGELFHIFKGGTLTNGFFFK